jgi:group I intron endonuclease
MYYIYKITNIINNKIYIGQTNNPALRWSQHKSNAKYNRNTQVITRAISKHGQNNFIFEVIASCLDQENVDRSEERIIYQYDSRNPDKGYNVDPGGNTTPRTPEILKKISDSLRNFYKNNYNKMKGKNLPEEWRNNISKASIGKPGTNSGKIFDDDWRLKISKSQVGKENKKIRRFNDITEKEICRLYIEEERSMYYLGKHFNCQRTLINDILIRNNVPKRQSNYAGKSNKNLFSVEEELKICKEYSSGNYSRREIAKKFSCNKTTIRCILLRHGINF